MRADPMGSKEWPFIYAGGSLLGERGLARGNWFYIDMGLQLRNPSAKLITGGFLIGVDGHWTSSSRKKPWIFELEMHAHANQAILVVDTTGWQNSEMVLTLDPNSSTLSLGQVNTDSLLNELFGPVYEKILTDATDKRNTVLTSRMESLFPVFDFGTAGSFYGGIIGWREDYLNQVDLNQWAGFSIRHQAEWKYLSLTQTLRYGWFTGGKEKNGVRYDLTVNFGRWQ